MIKLCATSLWVKIPIKKADSVWAISLGRLVGFEPTIFWATTRRVNPYTTAAMIVRRILP